MPGTGRPDDPYQLTTPPGKSGYQIWFDDDKQVWHCQVGKTWLHYKAGAVEALHAMLVAHGDWMELGNKDEKDTPKPDTVEAWGRSEDNPVGGWYGLRKGYRGRFANYITPILKERGLVEFEKRGRGWWVKAT